MFWVLICSVQLTLCPYRVTYAFSSESTLYKCLNVKELLAKSRCVMWNLSDCNSTWTQKHLVGEETLKHLAKLTKWLSCVLSSFLYGRIDCMFLSCHESACYNCLNVKETLDQSRRVMWSLSDCNWNLTQNHLLRKRTLNHFEKRLKWVSCVLSTYLYGAIDCIFLSCHACISEKISTL